VTQPPVGNGAMLPPMPATAPVSGSRTRPLSAPPSVAAPTAGDATDAASGAETTAKSTPPRAPPMMGNTVSSSRGRRAAPSSRKSSRWASSKVRVALTLNPALAIVPDRRGAGAWCHHECSQCEHVTQTSEDCPADVRAAGQLLQRGAVCSGFWRRVLLPLFLHRLLRCQAAGETQATSAAVRILRIVNMTTSSRDILKLD